jgi:hypothetical protein
MMNNHAKCISGNNVLTPVMNQENRSPAIPVVHDFITWHAKSKEEKLTTILIIISILSLLLTF